MAVPCSQCLTFVETICTFIILCNKNHVEGVVVQYCISCLATMCNDNEIESNLI